MNKKLAIVVLIALLINLLPIELLNAASISGGTPYYDGGDLFVKDPMNGQTWSEYKIQNNVPIEVGRSITVRGQTVYFNKELWVEKRIVVYGDYSYVPNEFKNATGFLDNDGKYVETPNKGYYEGGTGEYRYHGFDAAGNKYSNGSYPVDANSGRKAADKNWIYRIWEANSPYHKRADGSVRISKASPYNDAAMESINVTPLVIETRKWIADTLPFEVTYSNNPNEKSAYNYSHILTRPTSLIPGESVMWHHTQKDNREWYQVFSLDTIESKAPTPIQTEIVSINSKDVPVGDVVDKVYTVKVKATILDAYMYDNVDENGIADDVIRGAYLNREDVKEWEFKVKDHITNNLITVKGQRDKANTAFAEFTVTIPHAAYADKVLASNPSLEVFFTGIATVTYYTTQTATDDDVKSVNDPFPIVEELDPLMVEIDAPTEMLDTEKFAIVDSSTFPEGTTRTVEIDGQTLSPGDAENFISGNHIFPLIGEDKVYTYKVIYDDGKGLVITFADYVVVYTTKPKAQFKVTGTFKENRLITANTDVSNVNSAYLRANATINTNFFTAQNTAGDSGIIKFGTQNTSTLSYIVKDEAAIKMEMQVTANIPQNRIQRSDIPAGYHTSDVYQYNLFVLTDYEPALIANVWNSVLVRNETLDFYYDAASVDEDVISVNTYKIYYDTNGDNIPETLVRQGNYDDYTAYTPDKLGYYKIVFYAEETFGQPTLSQFITEADKRKFTLEREFYVDNLAPMTKIYTDIEYDFPQADVIVLNDQGITREFNNTIVQERVNWINSLRQSGIMGSVQVWDLYTYVYDKPASTTRFTGSSYPPSTTSYSSDGYSGTLSRYSVSNNPYQVDNGYYKTVTESSTGYADVDNYSGGTAVYEYRASGWVALNGWTGSDLPMTMSYSSGGWTGTLTKNGGTDYSDPAPSGSGTIGERYYRQFHWVAHYSGPISRQTQVWQSNWVWYDDYTGYYSGTIYKNVKQAFTPVFRNTADKYLVYFADSNVNNLADVQYIKSRGSVKVILVGKASTKTQLTHDYYIDSAKPLADIMAEVNNLVAENNPVENRQLVLVGQTFALNKADYDDENDPITQIGYQYVHDTTYYDNSAGLETGARAAFSSNKADYVSTVKTSFTKPGKYTVYRQISDTPTGMPAFAKDSNTPSIEIYVHRKPIADYTLDWDYNSGSATYRTTWVDKSYDLDHQYSDPNKGITDRTIMYRKTSGDNIWIYSIPDNLTPGTYELRYAVKDIEGVWSDEKVSNFTLSTAPAIQADAKLRTLSPNFTTSSIPSTEYLELYDVWTRYPYNVSLEIALYNSTGTTRVGAIKTVNYSAATGTKTGNDIAWNNITYQVANTITDGNYILKLRVYDSGNASIRQDINFPVTVRTPHDLVGYINGDSTGAALYLAEINELTAETSIYVQSVTTNVLGTNVPLLYVNTVGGKKQWRNTITVNESVGEISGTAVYTSTTVNGVVGTYVNGGKDDVDFITRHPLEITGTITPNPALAGERVRIVCNTKGRGETVVVDLGAVEHGRTITLTPDYATTTPENIFRGSYIIPMNTDDGTYPVTATVYRNTAFGLRSESTQMDLVVKGNMYQLIKPNIKDSN